MNRNLTATCYYCNEICNTLESMIEQDELTESNITKLIKFWRENSSTDHSELVQKYKNEC